METNLNPSETAMQKKAIILAGSTAATDDEDLPAQFLSVGNKPLLYYTIKTFLDAYDDLTVILVLPETHLDIGREIIDGYFDAARVVICTGGSTRFESVRNGISRLGGDDSIVFIHDGIRCLITTDLIRRAFDAAVETNTAIPVVPVNENLRIMEEDDLEPIDVSRLRVVQTPQTFHSKILQTAFDIDYKPHFSDEAAVVEAYGLKLNFIAGEPHNFKVNTPERRFAAAELLPATGGAGVQNRQSGQQTNSSA